MASLFFYAFFSREKNIDFYEERGIKWPFLRQPFSFFVFKK